MPPKAEDNPEETANAPEETGDDAEKKFWDTHEKRTTEILDKWFDKKVGEVRQSGSRNGGRTTLPKFMADLFFPVK